MKKFLMVALLLSAFLCAYNVKAQMQAGSHFVHKEVIKVKSSSSGAIALPSFSSDQRKKVKSAALIVKLKTGNFHQFSSGVYSYAYTVNFNVTPSSWFGHSSYSLSVNQSKPQAAVVRNITSFADANGIFMNGSSAVSSVSVSGITLSGPSTITTSGVDIRDSIQLELSYDIEYAIDIHNKTQTQSLTAAPALLVATGTGKTYNFIWDNNGYVFPNYEFQLLRLYNISKDSVTDEKLITANVDWSKALKIETQSEKTSLALTIAEGQGYYLWRVRPIGSYYDGGIASNKNYSEAQWSVYQANGIINVTSSYDASNMNCFFFTDPDDEINNIYSRIFTEENHVKETVTYANGLQQVKQTQTYLPSKDTTLVMQNIMDNSGRSAITTIPVPVNGNLGGYKQNFVKTDSAGTLYTADHFDKDNNYKNPSKIRQTSTDFGYYSNNNLDKQIPDAEGYPFTRVLFYEDGTNRVKEQSGVGRMHMIGDSLSGHGGGKTVKTMYTAPSETELIRLFGDEAPSSESVLKTITIDQNGTASVTYTSKEGHVIATSLAVQGKDNAGTGKTFDNLNFEPIAFQVIDTVRAKQATQSGMVSSKRLVFLDTTQVSLNYNISCKTLEEACSKITVDCGFKVKVIVHNLDKPASDIVLPENALSGNCINGAKTASWSVLTLPPGTYIIEKQLISASDPLVKIEDAKDKIEGQIMPLVNMIKGWLANVDCPQQLDSFYVKLKTLESDMSEQSNAWLDNKYKTQLGVDTFFTSEHTLQLTYLNSVPVVARIKSPCCDLKVPVDYFPPFRCDSVKLHDWNANGILDVNTNTFLNPQGNEVSPDFEGQAIRLLMTCPNITTAQAAQDTLQKYMNGWKPGDFNLMVYKMLTDRYSCEGRELVGATYKNTATNNPKPHQEIICGDTVTIYPDSVGSEFIQYKCKDLFSCWIAQVTALKESICVDDLEDVDGDPPYNPSAGFDGEEQGDQSVHDNHFDNNIDANFLVKWIAKKKVSKRMRDLTVGSSGSPPAIPISFKRHLVNEFLQCTGFSFAKILTPTEPQPFLSDTLGGFTYQVPALTLSTLNKPKPTLNRRYKPDAAWAGYSAEDINSDGSLKSGAKNLFPNIKDPVYAFKYFEYQENLPQLEFNVCYRDPNDCWDNIANQKVPCCATRNTDGSYDYSNCDKARVDVYPNIAVVKDGNDGTDFKYVVKEFCNYGKYVCPVTAKDWTCGQKAGFYAMLKGYVAVPDSFFQADNLTCSDMTTGSPSKAQNTMSSMNNGCKSTCDDRRSEFEAELKKLLVSKCYVIGGCKMSMDDNIIPQQDFNTMVDSMVSMCKGQCHISTFSCSTSQCRNFKESRFVLGNSKDEFGYPVQEIKMEFGVGGTPSEICSGGDCSSLSTHSYCELYKYKQATTWKFDLDIESRCNSEDLPTVTDTEVDCPSGNKNPDLKYAGKMADPNNPQPFVEESSNQFKVEVKVE